MTVATVSPISTNTTVIGVGDVTEVLEAMRSIQTESDRWRLAEVLAKKVPEGVKGFDAILDRASKEGVAGRLSIHTLRLYRDTAKRWPSDKRIDNVSFSAHREAMAVESIEQARKLLNDQVRQLGADKVTVAEVRKAVAIKNGNPPKAKGAKKGAKQATQADVLADLLQGAPKLIGSITDQDRNLDRYHAGLTKALAHVEKLRAKQARAKKPVAKASAPVAKAAPSKRTAKKAGDLRGM